MRGLEDLELLPSVFKILGDEPIPAESFMLGRAKIAFCKRSVWPKTGPGAQKAWDTGQELLKRQGVEVDEIEPPDDFDRVPELHKNVVDGEGQTSFLGSESLPSRA
jgi:Asp-tRNA(Asn)/Glu-tRNA(Gln) amidotransferase A subunit family amidase